MPGSSAFSSLPVRGVPCRCVGHPVVLTPQQTPQWLYVGSAVTPASFPVSLHGPGQLSRAGLVSLQVVLLCQPQPVPSQELSTPTPAAHSFTLQGAESQPWAGSPARLSCPSLVYATSGTGGVIRPSICSSYIPQGSLFPSVVNLLFVRTSLC